MSSKIPLRDYVDRRFEDQKVAVDAALAAAEKAVKISEDNNQNWRSNANEWRGAMSDRERDFLTRREFYVMIGTVVAVVSAVAAVVGLFLFIK